MRVRMTLVLINAVAVLGFSSGSWAHEGHGHPAWYDSVLHYLLEPLHLPLTLAALVAGVMVSRWVCTKLSRRTTPQRRK